MSLPVFTFCPEFGAREIRAPRTSPFQFGNGKERRYRFGLITDLRTWELTFDYNADAEREEILAFLEERGAWKVFEWTDPKGYFGRWRCKEWRTTWNGPRRHVIVCTFLEVDERVVLEAEPPSSLLPDMWMSRVTTGITSCIASVTILTSDGGSYQAVLIQEVGTFGERAQYVFRRNASGVLIWQRKFPSFQTIFFVEGGVIAAPILVVDGNDNLYIIYGRSGHLGLYKVYVFKINANGTLAWQEIYRRLQAGASSSGEGTVFSFENIQLLDAIYNPILNVITVAGQGSFGASPYSPISEVSFFNISPLDGNVVNHRVIYALFPRDQGGLLWAQVATLQIRNGRLFFSGHFDGATEKAAAIAELSLDLGTLFSATRINQCSAAYLFPASDGGWYSLCGLVVGSTDVTRFLKLSSSFTPLWIQGLPNGGGEAVIGRGSLRHRSVGSGGKITWVTTSAPGVQFGLPGIIGGGLTAAVYDHENTLRGNTATNLSAGQGVRLGFYNLSLIYDSVRSRMIAGSGDSANTTDGMRVFALGSRSVFEDRAARYLDAGVSELASFFAAVRSQLDGNYGQLGFSDSVNLPLAFPLTPEIRDDISIDKNPVGPGRTFENASIGIAYYFYGDPIYTAPTATGGANLVFYTGNGAVQRVSVDKLFTPALLLIANRAASNRKAIFNTFFSDRHYQGWNGTRTTIFDSTEVDGLVELAQGNFKIAGRLDSLNKTGENFAAFALQTIEGAHEIIPYVGTGGARTLPHTLGGTPQFIIIQRLAGSITLAGTALGGAGLNQDSGNSTSVATANVGIITSLNESSIGLGSFTVNLLGDQYYLHAFRSSDDWTIDNVSGPGTGTFTVSLGFQPKAILFKGATGVGTAWQLLYRPDGTTGVAKSLPLNAGSAVEADSTFASITADGFTILEGGPGNTGSSSAFYLAINTTSGQTPGSVQIPSASITVNPLAFTVAGTSSVAMPAVNVTVTALAPIQNNVPIPAVDITVTGLDPVQNNVPIPVVDVTVEALAPSLSP
jgi:phage-related protein